MPRNYHLSLVLASVVQGDAVNCNKFSKVLKVLTTCNMWLWSEQMDEKFTQKSGSNPVC